MTNAVKATAGRDMPLPVRLRLSSDKDRLLIEVWDADPRPPVLPGLGDDGTPPLAEEGGRGLFLVATLSQQWNWYASPQSGGKVIWSELRLSSGHRHDEPDMDHLREGTPPAMSSHPSHSSAAWRPETGREPAPAPDNAPGTALPRRPQPAGMDARQWTPPDPEVLQRVKAALARL